MSVKFHCDWKGCRETEDENDRESDDFRFFESWAVFGGDSADPQPSKQELTFHLCRKHETRLRLLLGFEPREPKKPPEPLSPPPHYPTKP